ncbi:hypothetical protein MLD38_026015 [Melastoma candidum]|uniref:Uncharacterized protein n=1 Tax=Melastoma candidum TaxID=119954 RepID=A0ACB9NXA0_9MYRT|nr:hypothetical protein MLD38_026015 [Melastoma candidum]
MANSGPPSPFPTGFNPKALQTLLTKYLSKTEKAMTGKRRIAPMASEDPRFKALSEPKIRVVHVFAPEIIETDTANFRDLVQRLTGKPAADRRNGHERKRSKVNMAREPETRLVVPEKPKPRKAVCFDLFRGPDSRERPTVKEEWDCGGYLKDFVDLDDGFMCELRGFRPRPPPHIEAPQPYALI